MDFEFDDLLDVDASSDAENRGSGVKREADSEPDKPAVKEEANSAKRRRYSDGHAGAIAQSSGSNELIPPKVEEGILVKSGPRAKQVKAEEKAKACPGCFRIVDTCSCYLMPGQPVVWAFPKNRGAWCRDCHRTWFNHYQITQALTSFGDWLAAAPANRTDFEWHLMAYLTFHLEGVGQIRAGMMGQRVTMLKWMGSVAGWNPFKNCVVPLGEALSGDSPYKTEALTPSNLINVNIDGVHTIGVMVAKAIGNSGAARPMGVSSPLQTLITGRRRLLSDSTNELALLQEHYGGSSDGQAGAAAITAAVPVVEVVAVGPRSAIEKRLQALIVQSKVVLDSFLDDQQWVQTLERAFTNINTTASALRVECGQAGEQELTLNTAASWSDGLAAGKRFLKFHREWRKSHHKPERLTSCAQPLADFMVFLRQTGRSPCKSLERLEMKIAFHCASKVFASLGKAVAGVLEKGLMKSIEKEDIL